MEEHNRSPEQQVISDNGMESLAQMPSFKEYREQIEGESAQKDEAAERLKSSREFIRDHYYGDNEYTCAPKEDLEEFIDSEDLKEVTKHGFSLEWLAEKGIISKTDRWTNANGQFGGGGYYWKYFRRDQIFKDARDIVADMAEICRLDGPGSNVESVYNPITRLHEILSKYDQPETLEATDYEDFLEMYEYVGYQGGLFDRFLFGNPEDNEPDPEETDKSVYRHSLRTFEILKDNPLAYMDQTHVLCSARRKLKRGEFEFASKEHLDDFETAMGVAVVANMETFLDELGERGIGEKDRNERRELVKSCLTRQFVLANHGRLSKNSAGEEIFSDEELIGTVHGFGDLDKLIGRRDPDYYLARHVGEFVKAGFDKDVIIGLLHDNDVPLHLEEIQDMRADGISDEDIIYASRAYAHYFPGLAEDGGTFWSNSDFGKARFSESDMLAAAVREIHDRDRR